MERYGSKSKITPYVLASWILAALGGLMFGYDIGISGGVTSMDEFLRKFFPHILERKMHAHENNYCKYNDGLLQLFTSSLYLAALVFNMLASKACTQLGRKPTITMASLFFINGSALCGFAETLWMLIFGRILFGMGVGFANEAVPLFLSEVAHVHHRGSINILFQLFITIGIFISNLINYGTSHMKRDGWRVSLGLAAIPGILLFVGSLIITESPPSLIQRGLEQEGKTTLQRIRANDDVEFEFQQMVDACQHARQVKKPLKKLFKKSGLPALVISTCFQIFQQFTGINAIMFYAPVLFQTLRFKSDTSLFFSVITGLVNVAATFVSIYVVDKVDRKKLLLQASGQMLISQIAIGAILLASLKDTGSLNKVMAGLVVILVCSFVMAFAWSWGPMGWLIPSEVFPIETRAVGFAIAVSTNMICTFIIAQLFLSMLCQMKAYIFFFFSAWILVMGLFVHCLFPDTKGVPTHEMEDRIWKKHSLWKKLF